MSLSPCPQSRQKNRVSIFTPWLNSIECDFLAISEGGIGGSHISEQ